MAELKILKIDGEVSRPCSLSYADLAAIDPRFQIADVRQIDPGRQGTAVRLEGILEFVGAKPDACYLGLHASRDDFHASIPLAPVRDRGFLIYGTDSTPLAPDSGGPVRFLIRDFAACHTEEIDECANVKYVDHLELTVAKGFDNRPADDPAHEALHRDQDATD